MQIMPKTLEADLEPGLLRTFLAVYRHRSFTRAAEERLLTQPAVSRQVKQLQKRLGVPLFEKLGKTVLPTDAGRVLAAQAAELLGQMERVAEAVRGFGDAEHGRLRIGASTTPGCYLLPPILGRFHVEHPSVELGLVIDNSLAIEQRIVRNELDIGFVGAHLTSAALRIERIAEDEIVSFCGKSHALSGRRRIDTAALHDQMWVVREKGSATRQLFERRLRRMGVKLTRTIELSSPEGIKALVAAGVGLSFMSALGLEAELRDGRLQRLAIAKPRLTRPIYAVRHAEKHESPVMEALLRQVRAHAGRSL